MCPQDLVGTFLGVFLAYGFVNPLAATLEHRAASEALYLECIKTGILAVHKGLPRRSTTRNRSGPARHAGDVGTTAVHDAKDEIIIKRKKGGNAAHHGRAWKVAFADFMTALMAFFMVMWLISMKIDIKVAVSAYFRDPDAFQTTKNGGVGTEGAGGSGILPGAATLKSATGPDAAARQAARQAMQQASVRLKGELAKIDGMKGLEKQVEVTLTNEGMRIELLDSDETMFFDTGSSKVKSDTERLLVLIAKELARLATPIIVEGHTARRPYSTTNGYSNWDLSVERANAVRRLMQGGGLAPGIVKEVRGHADLRPRVKENPFDARNRRVSIIVPFDGLPE